MSFAAENVAFEKCSARRFSSSTTDIFTKSPSYPEKSICADFTEHDLVFTSESAYSPSTSNRAVSFPFFTPNFFSAFTDLINGTSDV